MKTNKEYIEHFREKFCVDVRSENDNHVYWRVRDEHAGELERWLNDILTQHTEEIAKTLSKEIDGQRIIRIVDSKGVTNDDNLDLANDMEQFNSGIDKAIEIVAQLKGKQTQ